MLTTEFTRAPDDVPAMDSGPILPFERGPKKVPCTLPTKLTPIRELETRPWATSRATTYLDCGGMISLPPVGGLQNWYAQAEAA